MEGLAIGVVVFIFKALKLKCFLSSHINPLLFYCTVQLLASQVPCLALGFFLVSPGLRWLPSGGGEILPTGTGPQSGQFPSASPDTCSVRGQKESG